MSLRGKSGQITIFSVIILLAVMIFAGVLVDIARISAGRAIVKRAARSSATSLLANYGSKLKEDYGMFALPQSGENELKERFEEYLRCNLSIPGADNPDDGRTDLFGFRIENITVTPIFNLSENEVTKRQILEYMKYRAPTEIVEGFIKKLTAMKDLGNMSEAYRQKVSIDKILGRIDKSQQKLKKYIDGTGGSDNKFVNGFNSDDSWKSAFDSYNSIFAGLSALRIEIDSVNSKIETLKEQNPEGNGEQDDSTEETTGRKIESLKEQRALLQNEYSDMERLLKSIWNDLRYSLTEDFISANDNSAAEIKKIVEKGKQARKAMAELEDYLHSNFGSSAGEFFADFEKEMQNELDVMKSLILDGRKAEEMLEKVNGNSALLRDIADKLDEAVDAAGSGEAFRSLPAELLKYSENYMNVSYDYEKPDKGDKKDDPRSGKAEAVKKFISGKLLEDVNYIAEGIKKDDLPSFSKVLTKDFFREDSELAGIAQAAMESGENGADGAEYGGKLENIGGEADLYDEEGVFQENALGFISGIGRMITEKAADLRDNIYLNEYIMGTFKNSVPELKLQEGTVKDVNLHGDEKAALETFYDSEVEYVLHGNPSQNMNNIMTRGELLLVRFGLDTLHVYTDARKRTMASSMAAAAAGWWTGGAGIPVIANLIMCGWGMGEALYDVAELLDGKSLPVYKQKGDWRLDIGLPPDTLPKTDKSLYFNYYDYLRIFLLATNEEKKLDRIEDLIQLNMGKAKSGFKMSCCNTYLRVEVEVSMRYMFAALPFVRDTLKTDGGRYTFKELVYEGYK